MALRRTRGLTPTKWVGGLAEWVEGDTAHLSVAFTWKLPEARDRAQFHRACGLKVRAGGPGLFTRPHFLDDVADEVGGNYPDAVTKHNPQATFASRGCPVGCWFCIVPKMEGRDFTLFPEFTPRPILCDNNLSAIPAEYQSHIIARYKSAGVPLLDAQSGFEPKTFTEDVYVRWREINRGPWRFAYDESGERGEVWSVLAMLNHARPWVSKWLARQPPPSPKRRRVYVLIGNEPLEACMDRIRDVIAWGGDPHVQPYMKLNALDRVPYPRFDWTPQALTDVARWANRHLWNSMDFKDYNRHFRRDAAARVRKAHSSNAEYALFGAPASEPVEGDAP